LNKLICVFACALLSLLSLTGLAQRPANNIDAYATFSEIRANAPVSGCDCFWMGGISHARPESHAVPALRLTMTHFTWTKSRLLGQVNLYFLETGLLRWSAA
jgi:hypothetical protein